MTAEARAAAEVTFKSVSEDLRFADAKALFVGLVMGAWATGVYTAVGLNGLEWTSMSSGVWVTIVAFVSSVAIALGCALMVIYPWTPTAWTGSVHQLDNLRAEFKKTKPGDDAVASLAGLFAMTGDANGLSNYEKSLLHELARMGSRCYEKYWWVRRAVEAGGLAFILGLCVILIVKIEHLR